MSTHVVNLGILAHIDAGKTSLTERLLFENGAISHLGSVDGGDTTTDSSDLERQRGITIRSAVASFTLDDLQVNLVDTPGHPDFIAEVERALSVLDGAVLVVSAVEGVQAQTRVLMRSLQKLSLPTLVFVNKVDRMGARYEGLLDEIRTKLGLTVVAMSRVGDIGTRSAHVIEADFGAEGFRVNLTEILAEHDDAMLARFVEDSIPGESDLERVLGDQTSAGQVFPVYFGSALSGVGLGALARGIRSLLRPRDVADSQDLSGTVFAIERTSDREKIAYLRLFSGTVRERESVVLHRCDAHGLTQEYKARISRMEIVGTGSRRGPLTSGHIAKLRGLGQVRVGDRLGAVGLEGPRVKFSPPILASVARPLDPLRKSELHAALTALADEDPLIQSRTAAGGATSVLLYGAVQREVIAERLKREFGVEAVFEDIHPIYIERPRGSGAAVREFDPHRENDFWQTVGLRIDPRPVGAGNAFLSEVESGLIPRGYYRAIEEAALRTLQQGVYGWEVTDCAVTLTDVDYVAPMSAAADFRNLTAIVLLRALKIADTDVYEPTYAIEVDVPADSLSAVMGFLSTVEVDISGSVDNGSSWVISGEVRVRLLQEIGVALPGLTHGQGSVWHQPGRDRRVRGDFPQRERTDGNPFNDREYLRFLSNRAIARGSSTGD